MVKHDWEKMDSAVSSWVLQIYQKMPKKMAHFELHRSTSAHAHAHAHDDTFMTFGDTLMIL